MVFKSFSEKSKKIVFEYGTDQSEPAGSEWLNFGFATLPNPTYDYHFFCIVSLQYKPVTGWSNFVLYLLYTQVLLAVGHTTAKGPGN